MLSPTGVLLLVVLSTLFFDAGAITKPFDFRYALRSDLYIVFEDFDASKLEHALNLNDTADVANEISNIFISYHLTQHNDSGSKRRDGRKLLSKITPDEIAAGEIRGGTISEPTPTCRRTLAEWLAKCVYSFDG